MLGKKTIFHIDFDAYFVSAIRSLKPHLNNKPVVIGRNHSKAIATAVSYELKNLGVKPGMPIYKILKLVPNVIIEPTRFELYTTISNSIFDYLSKNYSSKIEVMSIDECFLDVSELVTLDISALNLGKKIQSEILEKFKIPITIGISDTKFYAKMTTNISKPFGVRLTTKSQIQENFYSLNIEKFYGIGKPTAEKLNKIGIKTIGDLANVKSFFLLENTVGIVAKKYLDEVRGLGSNTINMVHNDLKSIGNSLTFPDYSLSDSTDILKVFKSLCQSVSLRATNRNLVGKTISILIRKNNSQWYSKQKKLDRYISSFFDIFEEIKNMFLSLYDDEELKGVGVKLSNLENYYEVMKNRNIFNLDKKTNKIEKIIDGINYKMGKKVIYTLEEFARNKTKNDIQSKYIEEDTIWKKRK